MPKQEVLGDERVTVIHGRTDQAEQKQQILEHRPNIMPLSARSRPGRLFAPSQVVSLAGRDHRDTSARMSGPPHRARRAAPDISAGGIPPVLHRRSAASNARDADAGTETATDNRCNPVAPGAERPAPRLRTCRLSAAEVLPSRQRWLRVGWSRGQAPASRAITPPTDSAQAQAVGLALFSRRSISSRSSVDSSQLAART